MGRPTVLKRAAGTGCAGMVMVRRLLEAGAAVDATADSADLAPLMFAAYMYHGHEAVVSYACCLARGRRCARRPARIYATEQECSCPKVPHYPSPR